MQRIDRPNWEAAPTICSTCGSRVSAGAQSCAVCGAAIGGGSQTETMPFGTTAAAWRAGPEDDPGDAAAPAEVYRTFREVPGGAFPPPPSEVSCPICGAQLEMGARFCSECGSHVDTQSFASPPLPEPEDVVVHSPDPLYDGRFLDEEEGPGFGPIEDVVVLPEREETLREPDPRDDLRAPEPDVLVSAAEPPPAAEPVSEHDRAEEELLREARRIANVGPFEHTPPAVASPRLREVVREPEPEEEEEAETLVGGSEAGARGTDLYAALSWVPLAAAGFALFALAIAMLVHVFAPSIVAGYSPAELDLKVQMRAVEWLLAGILIALVGVLLKR